MRQWITYTLVNPFNGFIGFGVKGIDVLPLLLSIEVFQEHTKFILLCTYT